MCIWPVLTSVPFVLILFVKMPGYDEEARYFEAAVRADKRTELVAKAYAAVAGVRDAQLAALKARTLQHFQADLQAAVEAGKEGFSAAAARWGVFCLQQH